MFNLAPVPVPELSGKTVLVTGAGQGIGTQLVELLINKGAEVFAGVYGVPLAVLRKNPQHIKMRLMLIWLSL